VAEENRIPDAAERARLWAELVKSRDYDAMMRVFAPDGVWDLSPMGLGTYEGEAAIRAFFEDWIGAYDEFKFELQEAHDLGNGVTYAEVVQTARPAGSTGSVQTRYGSVAVWTGGLFQRTTNYGGVDEARAAAERLAEERR
jgi:ketosteroid isomerase-like protein